MSPRTKCLPTAVAAVALVLAAEGCQQPERTPSNDVILGAEARLGDGTVTSFARLDADGAPSAIGIVYSSGSLSGLPTARSDQHRCYDHDGSGSIEPDTECFPTHERVIPLPTEVSRRADIPFKWVLLNWNPEGHAPTEIFGLPHFDIHYYIEPIENVFALMPGPCGGEFLRCDQFEIAVRPVPSNWMHPDFVNVDAAAPAMGNHLVDLTGPEFHGHQFDRAWIYGAYDGHVTFWEEMVTRAYLLTNPSTCYDIKTPAGVEVAGYYPTRSCFAYDAEANARTASLEGFVYREASPPTS